MANSLKKNYIFNLAYRAVTVITPLITAPYLARVLTPTGIGQYSFTFSVAYFFSIFATLGIADYGNRAIAVVRDDRMKRSRVFCEIFALQCITSTVMISVYCLYSLLLSEDTLLALLQGLNIVAAFFDVTWFLFGMELFVLTTVRSTVVKVLTVILILLFVHNPEDLTLYVLIMAGGSLLSQIVVWPQVIKEINFVRVSISAIFRHLRPNLVLFLPVISVALLNYVDKVMIGMMSDMSNLGCYENAEKLVQIPNSLVTALGAVMLPRMSNLASKGEADKLNLYIEKSLLFVCCITCAFSFGMIGISKEFVPFFFGEGYDLIVPLLFVLSPCMIFISWSNVLKTQYLLPKHRDNVFVLCLGGSVLLNVILNMLLIPMYGAVGAAIATLIAEISISLSESIVIGRHLPFLKYIFNGLPFVVIGFIMLFSILFIDLENPMICLLFKFLVAFFVYGAGTVLVAKWKKIDILFGLERKA